MRTLKTIVLGTAAAALVAGAALAASQKLHTMTVALPDGGTATIQYTGDVKPNVRISSNPFETGFLAPAPIFFAPDLVPADAGIAGIEARMQQVAAQMDRQIQAALSEADTLAKQADQNAPMSAAFSNLPAGTESYSFISSTNGGKTCTKLTTVTSDGHGKPNVVTKTSGDCGASAHESPAKPADAI